MGKEVLPCSLIALLIGSSSLQGLQEVFVCQNLLKQALYNMAVGFIQVDEKGMPSKGMDGARDREDCQKVFKIVYGIIIKCWPQGIA